MTLRNGVPKESSAFIFDGQEGFVRYLEASGSDYPMTKRHVPVE